MHYGVCEFPQSSLFPPSPTPVPLNFSFVSLHIPLYVWMRTYSAKIITTTVAWILYAWSLYVARCCHVHLCTALTSYSYGLSPPCVDPHPPRRLPFQHKHTNANIVSPSLSSPPSPSFPVLSLTPAHGSQQHYDLVDTFAVEAPSSAVPGAVELKPVLVNNTGLLLGLGNVLSVEVDPQPRAFDFAFCPFKTGTLTACVFARACLQSSSEQEA